MTGTEAITNANTTFTINMVDKGSDGGDGASGKVPLAFQLQSRKGKGPRKVRSEDRDSGNRRTGNSSRRASTREAAPRRGDDV